MDSDDEWEEDEPGESLNGSDDEKDKESEDDYEVDNELFVPHGYLSDEENQAEEEEGEGGAIDDDNTPETQKAKLKILQQEFANEMKKKTEKIKPRLIGCIWQNANGRQPESCPQVIWDFLAVRSMITDGSIPFKEVDTASSSISPGNEDKLDKNKIRRGKITDDEIKDLIRLVHGNTHNRQFLVKEFRAFRIKKNEKFIEDLKELSNVAINLKIKEIANWMKCPEEGPMFNKHCWYVAPEQLIANDVKDLKLPNTWKYILPPTRIELSQTAQSQNTVTPITATAVAAQLTSQQPSIMQNIETNPSLIRKPNESNNDIKQKPSVTTTNGNSDTKIKKRVPLLMSVPCGQEIPQKMKNNLISQFLCVESALPKAKAKLEETDVKPCAKNGNN